MDMPQDNRRLHTDELQEVVALCDSDGIILSWNRAGEEITGYPRDDVLGYHIDSVDLSRLPRDPRRDPATSSARARCCPGLPVRLQTEFGWEVPAEVTSVPRLFERGEKGFLLIFRDVTLKTQLQEQLDRMDVLYRGLVENSPDLIYVLDAGARLLFINDTVETLLGYSKRDLIGRELIDIVHPEDRQRAYWPLRERRRADRATRNLRLRLLTRDGQTRAATTWVSSTWPWIPSASAAGSPRAASPQTSTSARRESRGTSRSWSSCRSSPARRSSSFPCAPCAAGSASPPQGATSGCRWRTTWSGRPA